MFVGEMLGVGLDESSPLLCPAYGADVLFTGRVVHDPASFRTTTGAEGTSQYSIFPYHHHVPPMLPLYYSYTKA